MIIARTPIYCMAFRAQQNIVRNFKKYIHNDKNKIEY